MNASVIARWEHYLSPSPPSALAFLTITLLAAPMVGATASAASSCSLFPISEISARAGAKLVSTDVVDGQKMRCIYRLESAGHSKSTIIIDQAPTPQTAANEQSFSIIVLAPTLQERQRLLTTINRVIEQRRDELRRLQ